MFAPGFHHLIVLLFMLQVNVLEADEDFEGAAELPASSVKISLGKLLSAAYDNYLGMRTIPSSPCFLLLSCPV